MGFRSGVNRAAAILAIMGLATGVALAEPAGPYDAITSAADFSAAGTAVGVIAAALAGFLVVRKGARFVLSMIR